MFRAVSTEAERLCLQKALDEERTQRERNEMGQFATPPALAEDIVTSLLKMELPHSIDFIEPACGSGSFFSALLRLAGQERINSAHGIELDQRFAATARQLWASAGFEVETADFTQWSEDTIERFDLLIANPPYVRHHHLHPEQKERLVSRAIRDLQLKPSGLSGLYVHFILSSHRVLRPGAISAWLIPAEFMDVNYGTVLREYLSHNVTLLRIHNFDSADVQFADALVSSAVVIFKNTLPTESDKVSFTFGGSVTNPRRERVVPALGLDPTTKWSAMSHLWHQSNCSSNSGPTLADFFTIRRGIATGANRFFIMDREDARQRGFDDSHLTPIMPSPRYLCDTIVGHDEEGWPLLNRQLALLNCTVAENQLRSVDPALANYFDAAGELGITDRYLLKKRQPWYRQEQRAAAPFLCTYMGRSVDNDRPFRFILNLSQAIATNMYLMLYPKANLVEFLDQDPAHMAAVHTALLSLTAEDLRRNGRVYGGGLHKIEPRELASLPAQGIVALDPGRLSPTDGESQQTLALS